MNVDWFAVANTLGIAGIVLWFLKDRRRDAVATRVAERTESLQVDLSSITAAQAHLGMVNQAFDAERTSMQRRVEDAERALVKCRTENEQYRATIEVLQAKADDLATRVRELQAEVSVMRQRQRRRPPPQA